CRAEARAGVPPRHALHPVGIPVAADRARGRRRSAAAADGRVAANRARRERRDRVPRVVRRRAMAVREFPDDPAGAQPILRRALHGLQHGARLVRRTQRVLLPPCGRGTILARDAPRTARHVRDDVGWHAGWTADAEGPAVNARALQVLAALLACWPAAAL